MSMSEREKLHPEGPWRVLWRYVCLWLMIYLAAIAGALHAPQIARLIAGW